MTPEQVNELPDELLLMKISEGDGSALACFYDRTAPVLYSIAKRILRDASLAEDLVQEVYAQIWQKASLFDPTLGKPMNWAITLTRNRALDKLRAMKRFSEAMSGFAEDQNANRSGTQKQWAETAELFDLARQGLAELPEAQRRAIELAFMHGLAHAEVAQRMQQPLGTVKAWIRRGMLHLRERMSGAG
jgi:RNA polymerase sigma-70 factor (ECF subfamily)